MKNGTKRGLCCEPRCRNLRRKDRHRCFTCDSRRRRKANPAKAAYRALKDHATARGIPFSLSFPYFFQFALASDYINGKGSGSSCLTVDRINNLKGYIPGNIQAVTRERNSIKRFKQDAIRMKAGYAWKHEQVD